MQVIPKKNFENGLAFSIKSYPVLDQFFIKHLKGFRMFCDYGCGYGGWTKYIADLLGARFYVYDPDEKAMQFTKALLGESYAEPTEKYDSIICFGVLELLSVEEQIALLSKMCSMLNDTLIVQYNLFNPYSLRWLMIRLLHGNPISWHERQRFHRSYLPRREVEALFLESGLSIVERCTPVIENHLPRYANQLLAPFVPLALHATVFYALKKNK